MREVMLESVYPMWRLEVDLSVFLNYSSYLETRSPTEPGASYFICAAWLPNHGGLFASTISTLYVD